MTCVAAIVVPLVVLTVPSTRTLSPFVMALAEVELVPFWYVVEDASSTVTFWPPDVVNVKPDVDTLLTVPDAPPAAGPDRAFELEVEREEEAVAVPLLLLPQAARITVATSMRKVTLTNVFSDSDVRFDMFFPSFSVSKWVFCIYMREHTWAWNDQKGSMSISVTALDEKNIGDTWEISYLAVWRMSCLRLP
jgi:hypothetical protein